MIYRRALPRGSPQGAVNNEFTIPYTGTAVTDPAPGERNQRVTFQRPPWCYWGVHMLNPQWMDGVIVRMVDGHLVYIRGAMINCVFKIGTALAARGPAARV
jgi:hypothetical protein